MKKFYYSLAALLFIAAGCSNDEFVDDKLPASQKKAITTVTGLLEEANTRTQMSGKSVLWDGWENIGVFSDLTSDVTRFSISNGSGTSNATFVGDKVEGQNLFYAVYPNNNLEVDAENKVVTINEVWFPQYMVEGREDHAHATMPMMAISENEVMQFNQLSGILHFRVTGSIPVIGFGISFDNEFNNFLKVSYATGVPVVEQQIQSWGDQNYHGRGSNCWFGEDNQLMLSETPVDVYIILPPTKFENGFTFNILKYKGKDEEHGWAMADHIPFSTSKVVDLKAGEMKKFPDINLTSFSTGNEDFNEIIIDEW